MRNYTSSPSYATAAAVANNTGGGGGGNPPHQNPASTLMSRLKSFSHRVWNRNQSRSSVYLPLHLDEYEGAAQQLLGEEGYDEEHEPTTQQQQQQQEHRRRRSSGPSNIEEQYQQQQRQEPPTPTEELDETQMLAREAASLLWEALAMRQQQRTDTTSSSPDDNNNNNDEENATRQMLNTCRELSRRLNASIGDLMGEVDERTLALAVEASDMLSTAMSEHDDDAPAAPPPSRANTFGLDALPPSELGSAAYHHLSRNPALISEGHAFVANHYDDRGTNGDVAGAHNTTTTTSNNPFDVDRTRVRDAMEVVDARRRDRGATTTAPHPPPQQQSLPPPPQNNNGGDDDEPPLILL